MTCRCAYAKANKNIGRGIAYECRSEKRKKETDEFLCCATYSYSTGHATFEVENNFEKMDSCSYKTKELTDAERIKFYEEDEKEREEMRELEKSLAKMTPEDWERLKIQAYADY